MVIFFHLIYFLFVVHNWYLLGYKSLVYICAFSQESIFVEQNELSVEIVLDLDQTKKYIRCNLDAEFGYIHPHISKYQRQTDIAS